MAHRQSVLALDRLFEDVAEHTGLDFDDLALAVHADQPVQLADVQHDAATHRQRGAGHVAAAGGHG
ncbi:hypothetical protein D3C72_2200120 [compost metagenome]